MALTCLMLRKNNMENAGKCVLLAVDHGVSLALKGIGGSVIMCQVRIIRGRSFPLIWLDSNHL